MAAKSDSNASEARIQEQHSSRVYTSCTIKDPPFSYAQLELATEDTHTIELDELMVKSYCTAALRQYLGLTGEAIPIDILKAQGQECWVRLPKQDLTSFAAAITAWNGSTDGDIRYILRLKQCADWLGLLVGKAAQDQMWEG